MFVSMVRMGLWAIVHAHGRSQVVDLVNFGHRAGHQRLVGHRALGIVEPRVVPDGGQVGDRAGQLVVDHRHAVAAPKSVSTRWLPIKPAPPVTRTFCIVFSVGWVEERAPPAFLVVFVVFVGWSRLRKSLVGLVPRPTLQSFGARFSTHQALLLTVQWWGSFLDPPYSLWWGSFLDPPYNLLAPFRVIVAGRRVFLAPGQRILAQAHKASERGPTPITDVGNVPVLLGFQ